MKILRLESSTEQKIQQVEALMTRLGIRLSIEFHSLVVIDNERGSIHFPMRDIESNARVTDFPRMFESERIVVPE